MNMFLLSSISNMIIYSASRWVGGQVGGGRLIGWSVVHDITQEKKMFVGVILPVHFG